MNTPTILVTGATGNVGRPLVADLLADGARVRALTRNPAAAGFPPGVAVTGGDYAAPGTLAEAVRGSAGARGHPSGRDHPTVHARLARDDRARPGNRSRDTRGDFRR